MVRSRAYQESLLKALQDTVEAATYLDAALEEGDNEAFLLALQNVADARLGGITDRSKETGLSQESWYNTLSEKGSPQLASLDKLLHALGLRLAVQVDEDAQAA